MLPGDVRLIAATSRRLLDLVSAGEFHDGLFNRLNMLPIWLPPLRERRADIPDLARTLVARLAAETGQSTIVADFALGDGASVAAYDWPGNVGELAHAIRRAVVLCGGGELSPQRFSGARNRPEPPAGTRDADPQSRSPAGVAVQEQAQRRTEYCRVHRLADRPNLRTIWSGTAPG